MNQDIPESQRDLKAEIRRLQQEIDRLRTVAGETAPQDAPARPGPADPHEDRLRLIMDATYDGLWDWNIRTGEVYINDQYYAMLGYAPGEISVTLETWKASIHPEDVDRAVRIVDDLLDGRIRQYELECRFRTKTGEWRWLLDRGRAVAWDAAGRPTRVVGAQRDITERKKTREDLERANALLTALIESLPDLVAAKDLSGRYVLCNRSFLTFGGVVRPGDVIGKTSWEAFPQDVAKFLDDTDQEVLTERRPIKGDVWRTSAAGKKILLEFVKVPLFNASGQVSGVIGLARDITERWAAQQALSRRLEVEALLAALSSELVGLSSSAIDAAVQRALARVAQFLGMDRGWALRLDQDESRLSNTLEWCAPGVDPQLDLVQNQPYHDFHWFAKRIDQVIVIEDVNDLPPEAFAEKEYLQGLEISTLISAPMVHDGRTVGRVGFDASAGKRKWADEEVLLLKSFAGILAGVLARKKFEEDLQAAHQRLTDIIDFLPDATFVVDQDRKVVAWNRAMEELSGVSQVEMLGRGDQEYAIPFYGKRRPLLIDFVWSNEDHAREHYRNVDRCGRTMFAEADMPHLRNGDGARLWGLAAPLFDSKGRVVGAIESFRDITERKNAEEERLRLENQLRQAQKMEAIGTLAGGIAHDFNNILGAIIGYTEMSLFDAPAGSDLRANMEEVLKAGRRAAELVRHILAFSRQAEQEKKPVEIAPILKETLKLLRASLPSTIEIRTSIGENAGLVLSDPVQLHQVMMNLCTNAAYAMEETGGQLSVDLDLTRIDSRMAALQPDLAPGDYVRITVSDTGPGIDPRIRDRIFEPYFTTKPAGVGTGMGLSIVHGIVKKHNGAVALDTALGRGTAFYVYLPRFTGSPQDHDVLCDGASGGHERILFVDDEDVLVEVAMRMLEHMGYRVVGTASSLEALEMFKKRPMDFDLVITDQTMPKLTGLELGKRILAVRPDMPIILCTGYSGTVSAELARLAGIQHFLMKPFIFGQLAAMVRSALDRKPDTPPPVS